MFYRYAAACVNHYMVIHRPLKYIKTKIKIPNISYGVRFRSPSVPSSRVKKFLTLEDGTD
jgi:hypothetical protein